MIEAKGEASAWFEPQADVLAQQNDEDYEYAQLGEEDTRTLRTFRIAHSLFEFPDEVPDETLEQVCNGLKALPPRPDLT